MTPTSTNKNWKPEKLADICAQITDGKHGDCQGEPDSGFYFLSCKDVANGKLNYDGARQITEADFRDTHRRTKFEPSDILITNSGTIGRMALAPNNELTHKTTFQKSVAILKPITSKVEPRFLYYALQSDVHRLIEFAGGTAQKNLLLRDLRAFEVRIPLLQVQRRLASILSAYDDLIENNTRRIKILERMARSLYREWFVDSRFPGHEKLPRVPSSLGDIPQGWCVKKLGEVANISWGDTSTTKAAYVDSGYDAYSASGLDGKLDHFDYDRTGIVLSAIGAQCGKTWLARGKWSCIKNTIRFWSKDECASTEFLFIASEGQDFWPRRGAAQPFISQGDAERIELLTPDRVMMRRFTVFASSALEQIATLQEQIENLKRMRDLLLPKLISGEIDVSKT